MKKRFVYIEDDPTQESLIFRSALKLGVEVHWLPNMPSLNMMPDSILKYMDFVLIDCHGTSLGDAFVSDKGYSCQRIETIATSSNSGLIFDNIKFIPKDEVRSFLRERYA